MFLVSLINYHTRTDKNGGLQRTDESSFKAVRGVLLSQQPWNSGEPARGTLLLAWLVFLESRATQSTDSQSKTIVIQELDTLRKTWFAQFGTKCQVYAFVEVVLVKNSLPALNMPGVAIADLTACAVSNAFLNISSSAQKGNDIFEEEDIRTLALQVAERMVVALAKGMKHHLRQVIVTDQDTAASQEEAAAKALYSNQANAAISTTTAWETFLSLISSVYKDRPDAAREWWSSGELFNFLRLASDVWSPRFITSFLELLASLSAGPACALKAHEVLNSEAPGHLGLVLWSTFFRTLHSYVQKICESMEVSELKSSEIGLLKAFFKLLSQCAKHSFTARRVLCENQHYRALTTLFQFLTGRVPVDMKAAILETIAAFCAPGEGSAAIVFQVWSLIEQCQVIPTLTLNMKRLQKVNSVFASSVRLYGLQPSGTEGIVYDIREIEILNQTYPETIALLGLIKALIENLKEGPMIFTVETLGSPSRVPGIRLYISFVIDEIFLKVDEMPFRRPVEKLKIVSLCFDIFVFCLELFAVNSILADVDPAISYKGQPMESTLRFLGLHPGFEVLSRFLSGGKATEALFAYLSTPVTAVNEGSSPISLQLMKSVFTLTAIVFELQLPFLEKLCPAILSISDVFIYDMPSSMAGLDQYFAYHKDCVVSVAMFINCYKSDVLCVKALGVLTYLSQSPYFKEPDGVSVHKMNRMAHLLASSEESLQILYGFVDRLDADSAEFTSDTVDDSTPSVKKAILELILRNVDSPIPSVAHFLLGYKLDRSISKADIPDPNDPEARISCFHSIIGLLTSGTPWSSSGQDVGRMTEERRLSIYGSDAELWERSLRLLFSLCSQPLTSGPTLRYLRNREDFAFKQFSALNLTELSQSSDMRQSSIRLWHLTWTLKLLALELHNLALSGRQSQTSRILKSLFKATFTNEPSYAEDSFDQSVGKIRDILNFLDLREMEHASIDLSQSIFENLDYSKHIVLNDNEVLLYDMEDVMKALSEHIRKMEGQGGLSIPGGSLSAHEDMRAILSLLLQENHIREFNAAQIACVSSWSQLVRSALTQSGGGVSQVLSENNLFLLLGTLLARLVDTDTSSSIVGVMSEVVLLVMVKIRDRGPTKSFEQAGTMEISEAVRHTVLRGIIECILSAGISSVSRGNYESALLSYLLLFAPKKGLSRLEVTLNSISSESLGNLEVLKSYGDKLLDQLCKDATDGDQVWRIVALSCLGCLLDLDSVKTGQWNDSERSYCLDFMVQRNYVAHYIRSIKQQYDDNLQRLLLTHDGRILFLFRNKRLTFSQMKLCLISTLFK